MRITKLGHCCLLIEVKEKRILTDPGAWTIDETNDIAGLDVIVITHEHADHLHVETVKELVERSPDVTIVTNKSVGVLLQAEGIAFQCVEHSDELEVAGVSFEGYGEWHAEIYKEQGMVQNTGYMIGDRLFYPGDALTDPQRPVDILALPVAGPWIKISEAINYGLKIKPAKAFPVHDGMLAITGPFHNHPNKFLTEAGIEFVVLEKGQAYDL